MGGMASQLPDTLSARRAAEDEFIQEYPQYSFRFCQVYGVEPDRFLIKLFYRSTPQSLPPSLSILYAVVRNGSCPEKLTDAESESYPPPPLHWHYKAGRAADEPSK